jgi:hypothetical protein
MGTNLLLESLLSARSNNGSGRLPFLMAPPSRLAAGPPAAGAASSFLVALLSLSHQEKLQHHGLYPGFAAAAAPSNTAPLSALVSSLFDAQSTAGANNKTNPFSTGTTTVATTITAPSSPAGRISPESSSISSSTYKMEDKNCSNSSRNKDTLVIAGLLQRMHQKNNKPTTQQHAGKQSCRIDSR